MAGTNISSSNIAMDKIFLHLLFQSLILGGKMDTKPMNQDVIKRISAGDNCNEESNTGSCGRKCLGWRAKLDEVREDPLEEEDI